ncbi:hypothetical protein BD779DRAFT_1804118 [Infundibulicybe gibba]|nr:hypothetical protein BD779DRAFT_1804118 [Infundibulicybe gibba]
MTTEDDDLSISERETQFIPQEDDDENLWEVIEITAQRKDQYRVRWAGLDPKTKQPWPLSWVPRHDCTDELVLKWKLKQAKKKKGDAGRSSLRDSNSIMSKDGRLSSTSKRSDKSRSTSTSTSTTKPTPVPSTSRATVHGELKRKREGGERSSSEELPGIHVRLAPISRPGKRRKVPVPDDMASPETSKRRGKSREIEPSSVKRGKAKLFIPSDDDEVFVYEDRDVKPSPANQPKENIRKQVDPFPKTITPVQPQPVVAGKKTRQHVHGSTSRDSSSPVLGKETLAPSMGPFGNDPLEFGDPIFSPHLSSDTEQRLRTFDLDLEKIKVETEPSSPQNIENSRLPQVPRPRPPSVGSDLVPPAARTTAEESRRRAVVPETQNSSTRNTQSRSPVSAGFQIWPSAGGISQRRKSLTNTPPGNPKAGPLRPTVSAPTLAPHLPVSSIQTFAEAGAGGGDQPVSSIEQFSSPAKSTSRNPNTTLNATKRHNSTPPTPLADVLVRRAEPFQHRIKGNGPVPYKRTLMDIIRVTGSNNRGQNTIKRSLPFARINYKTKPKQYSPSPSEIVQEMEDTYLDLHPDEPQSGNPPPDDAKMLLREEEEESTQDILQASEEQKALKTEARWHEVAPEAVVDDLACSPNLDESSLQPLPPGSSLIAQGQDAAISSQDSQFPLSQPPDENSLDYTDLPPTASTQPNTTPSQTPQDSQDSQDKKHHLSAAMTLLNVKSEEIAKLDNLLNQERKQNTDLLQKLEALEASKITWEAEHSTLSASLQTALDGRNSAEKDRDFFREQYGRASGFVTSVREENVELEERASLAETRARDGVAMVKATFEQRIKSLENDLKSWKQVSTFLMEKDKRTDDEVRRRAAEEPELRERCGKLEELCESFVSQTTMLEDALERKENELLIFKVEAESSRNEANDLRKQLEEVNAELERIRSEHQLTQGHDEELVYRCEWREDNKPCEDVFSNKPVSRPHYHSLGSTKILFPGSRRTPV